MNSVYIGNRGEEFKSFIQSLLAKGGIKKDYIDLATDDTSIKVFHKAFTSETVDMNNNYQVLEMKGDVTANKFIINYMYDRFPKLNCIKGVKIVARLRINYGSKTSFSEIARSLGFWKYISATVNVRKYEMKDLLEDVFEAFIGAIEQILDTKTRRIGFGYSCAYHVLKSIFDEKQISLKYEDLYDSKTRLKELFDYYKDKLGPLTYEYDKITNKSTISYIQNGKYNSHNKYIGGGTKIIIASDRASSKNIAQQKSSQNAIHYMNSLGFVKTAPEIYKILNSSNNSQISTHLTKSKIIETWGDDVNILKQLKSKRKDKYMCTPIAYYCKQRNIKGVEICLEMNADTSIKDTNELFPLDLLFIGNTEVQYVKPIFELLSQKGTVRMHKDVFNLYYNQYNEELFPINMESISFVP